MTPETDEAVQQLRETRWFEHVGEPSGTAVIVATSWSDAMRVQRASGDSLRNQGAAELLHVIRSVDRSRAARWNQIVDEVSPCAREIAELAIEHAKIASAKREYLKLIVESDIVRLLINAENRDIVPQGFFYGWAHFYTSGRFPCGWDGPRPGGKPIIF